MHASQPPARTRVHQDRSVRGSRWAALILLVLSSSLAAGDAAAQQAELIRFDFTAGSSFSLLGGTIVTPPDGTVNYGFAMIYVEATAPGVYVPGGLFDVQALKIGGTIAKNVGGQANVSGTYSANQVAPLVGTLAPGATGGDFAPATSLSLDTNIQIGCTGSGCASLGLPASDIGLSLLSVSFLPVTDLGVEGSAQINLSFPIEVDGVLGSFNLVGVEISRTFVPEPGSFVLVATGFGLLAARRRRSRRIG